MKADNVFTEKYNKNNFKKALKEIRSFTVKSTVDFENRMKELCRQSGVANLGSVQE